MARKPQSKLQSMTSEHNWDYYYQLRPATHSILKVVKKYKLLSDPDYRKLKDSLTGLDFSLKITQTIIKENLKKEVSK